METPEPLPVTAKQLRLLKTMRRWALQHGRMPSIRELAELLRRSPSTVHQHLGALEKRGCIERDGSAHGLKLLVDDKQLGLGSAGTELPLKGVLAPGRRLRRSRTPYPRLSVGGETRRGDYLVRVEGDRLVSDGIYDGDLLMVRPGSAEDQPAVVEYPDGSLDVKRVTTLRDGSLGLLPPRPHLETRRGARRAVDVVVRGRVVRIVRVFE